MSKKKNKKKEDSILESAEVLQEQVLHAESFLERRGKVIIIVFVVIVLALGGNYGYYYFQNEKENKAQKEMFTPQIWYDKDSLDLALNGKNLIPGFLSIAKKYEGTNTSDLAKFYVASIYMQKEEYDQAISYLSGLKFDGYLLDNQTKVLLGDAYAQNDNLEKAVKLYVEAATNYLNPTFSLDYMKKAAIALEKLDRKDEAIKLYTQALEEFPTEFKINSIKKELSRLTKKPYY